MTSSMLSHHNNVAHRNALFEEMKKAFLQAYFYGLHHCEAVELNESWCVPNFEQNPFELAPIFYEMRDRNIRSYVPTRYFDQEKASLYQKIAFLYGLADFLDPGRKDDSNNKDAADRVEWSMRRLAEYAVEAAQNAQRSRQPKKTPPTVVSAKPDSVRRSAKRRSERRQEGRGDVVAMIRKPNTRTPAKG